MRHARSVLLTLLATLTFGSLLISAGYGWYLRSPGYRARCATTLSRHLGLPSQIGQIVPHSRAAREFRDVRVWLPHRRGEAAWIDSALLRYEPTPENPEAYTIELRGGHTEVSTRTWLRDDYRFVLESGLRPGFDPAGPTRVVFSNLNLAFQRDRFRMDLSNTRGAVNFANPQRGLATMQCAALNGHTAERDVTLSANFSPQSSGIRLDQVVVTVPELPIAIIGLRELVGLDLRTGSFLGQLHYAETDAGRELAIQGTLYNLQLPECTAPFVNRPWRGTIPTAALEELTLLNDRVTKIRFRGLFADVLLGDILAPLGLGDIGGRMLLRVRSAELSERGIDRFIVSGRCENVSLARLSAALNWGTLSGQARLIIDDFTVIANRLDSLDAEFEVRPTASEPTFVDRAFVSTALDRTLGISLPAFLPEQFDYAQLGMKLEARDELLFVFGNHGPGKRAILSVDVAGQPLPVIFEPARPFNLTPQLDELRNRVTASLKSRLQALTPHEAWRAISTPRQQDPPSPKPE
jgi:hypothetical protein